jgi:uncharacterized protein with PIN domain
LEIARVNKCIALPVIDEEPILDSMLGWLARWLRMLGVRVNYSPNFADDALINMSHLLITRDKELFRRRVFISVLLETSRHAEWLSIASLILGIPLKLDLGKSLCPVCGSSLIKVNRETVVDRVPRGVLMKYDDFWLCTGCGKVYWIGSHHTRIKKELDKAQFILTDLKASCTNDNLLIIRSD